MKLGACTLALVALCGNIGVAQAATQSVVDGVWGYVNVHIPSQGGVNFVGVNFSSSQEMYLPDIFFSGTLVNNANPSLADTIYLWDVQAQDYNRYFQKPDGLFYAVSAPDSAAVQVEVKAGDALFIKSPASISEAHTICLTGTISLESLQTRSYASKMVFANLHPVSMNLNAADLDWSSATSADVPTMADQVHIWDAEKPGGPGFRTYFLKAVGGAKQWHSGESPFLQADPIIPPGGGAFYTAVGSYSHDIIRPFDI